MAIPEAFNDADWQLFQLQWHPIEEDAVRAVAVLCGDGQPLPFDLASQLIDRSWDAIARYCLDQGYAHANLYATHQEAEDPIVFKVPAAFAHSPKLLSSNPNSNWITFPRPCAITATRFIPFFLGGNAKLRSLEVCQFEGIPCYRDEDLYIAYSWDGFAVAIVQEESVYRDVAQFLWERRQTHLEILRPDSTITQELIALQDGSMVHPLIRELPTTLSYVMSVHSLTDVKEQIPEETLRLLAEPSILGISDGVNETVPDRLSHVVHLEALQNAIISVQRSSTVNFYSTWANVVEVRKGKAIGSRLLLQQEVQLQRIWYKLFLFSEELMHLSAIDEGTLTLIRQTQQEFLNFVKANPTASTLENGLREDLVQTSKIRDIYEGFVEQANLVGQLIPAASGVSVKPDLDSSDLIVQPKISTAAKSKSNLYKTQTFIQECVALLLQAGLENVALAAFRATSSWEDSQTFVIKAASIEDAKLLRQQHCFWIKQAAVCGVEQIMLYWEGCDIPYRFKASVENLSQIPTLRSDNPELAALQIGEIMGGSDLPMGLIDLALDDQVWANTALADLKGTSIEACRRENVRRLWQPEGLQYIKDTLRQQSEFVHRYQADLNPGDLRQFYSRFQLVIDGRYRLTTLFEWEPT